MWKTESYYISKSNRNEDKLAYTGGKLPCLWKEEIKDQRVVFIKELNWSELEKILEKETYYNKKVSSYLEEALKEEIMTFEQLWSDVIQEKISGLEVSQNLYSDIENINRELSELFVEFENERNNLPKFYYTNYKYQIEI